MSLTQHAEIWAIVPAAGFGSRMQSEIPKQYLPLLNRTVIEITLNKLLSISSIKGIVLVLNSEDNRWALSPLSSHSRIHRVSGGTERSGSVLNGLNYCLSNYSGDVDQLWTLVHDAARPCVSIEKISELIDQGLRERHLRSGAILAVPCADTIKRVTGEKITQTVDRAELWSAHTPQFFPCGLLSDAITHARARGGDITDEASAVESIGGSVSVLRDRRDNIKITMPEDLLWAETILRQQG